ncbi:hypothetical protein DMUE_3154 [Dictyocoela muelleri]|nr:hypothetical protein DMUE_3154 [Dictyocoela muelleri]
MFVKKSVKRKNIKNDKKSYKDKQTYENKQEPRHRNWLFTSFDINLHERIESVAINFEYLVMQLEQGLEDGKLHYQGMIICRFAKSLTKLKKIFNDNTIHLEIVRNIKNYYLYYHNKYTAVGKRFEFGTPPLNRITNKAFYNYEQKNYEKNRIRDNIYNMIIKKKLLLRKLI